MGRVLAGLPAEACGMPVDVLLVDDGSRDSHRRHRPRARRDGDLAPARRAGLGAALRTGLEHARDEGYAAAVYLDGDGEYDPADFATRARARWPAGRADYVIGSRFLGRARGDDLAPHARQPRHERAGGPAHRHGRRATPSPATAPSRPGRSPSPASAHDYNYAQVLTLSLWGARIEPVGGARVVPPAHQRPLVRALPGVPGARGAGGLARVADLARDEEEHHARRSRRRARTARCRASWKTGQQRGERPERRVGPAGHERAAEEPRVGVDPGARQQRSAPPARRRSSARACRPSATAGSPAAAPASRCRGGNQKPNMVGARKAATSQLDAEHQRRRGRR